MFKWTAAQVREIVPKGRFMQQYEDTRHDLTLLTTATVSSPVRITDARGELAGYAVIKYFFFSSMTGSRSQVVRGTSVGDD